MFVACVVRQPPTMPTEGTLVQKFKCRPTSLSPLSLGGSPLSQGPPFETPITHVLQTITRVHVARHKERVLGGLGQCLHTNRPCGALSSAKSPAFAFVFVATVTPWLRGCAAPSVARAGLT